MIRAYFDESGTDEQDYAIVAGHAGRKDEWLAFMPEWAKALGKQRERLHMRNLRWNSRSTEKLLSRLGPLPRAAGLIPIVGGVRVADYEDLVAGNSFAQLVRGYPAALLTAVTALLRAAPDNENVEIVMESNAAFDPIAAMIFTAAQETDAPSHLLRDGSPKLSKASLLSKQSPKSFLLDQADYLAFAHLQEARAPQSKKSLWTTPIRGECLGRILRRDEARSMVAGLPPSPFSEKDIQVFFSGVREALKRAAAAQPKQHN